MRQNDTRSVAMQMELWYTKKREQFQRVINKPIQNRSDVDIKLLADYISQSKSLSSLSSASIDELARATHFQMFHDGEVLFHQGDAIQDTSGRLLVIQGSLCVYKNRAYGQRARSGDDYVQWFLAENPDVSSDAVRFGDCIDTCAVGDTCGDDALAGLLFRETTVIAQAQTIAAYITQASFKRVCRYNVTCDATLLNAVSTAFHPSKPSRVDMRSTFVAASKLSDDVLADKERIRLIQRFFAQFSCVRILPASYRLELMRKVEARVYRSDEVLCHASDATPKMFMVLSGRICVHSAEPFEATKLRSYDETNYAFNPPTLKRRANLVNMTHDCEAPTDVATRGATTHICTLTAGDVFGEVGIRERSLLQGATLFNPIKSGAPSLVLTLSYDDYSATLSRYLDATEFTPETAYAILSETLPQDRSCEQLAYVWAYLTHKSSAQVFFNQLPLFTLNKICLHASVETHAVGDDIVAFIQREDEPVSCMRVVLNGYVCAFKNTSRQSSKGSTTATSLQPAAPKPAVLTRFQSRLIRGNTKILDEFHAATAVQTAASSSSTLSKQASSASDAPSTIDPVSIFPHGAAFGHHQIFTGSKSPYSYAAYSAGSTSATTPAPHHQSSQGRTLSSNTAGVVYLLSIPARFVKICFATIDEFIVYNPVRVFKRIANEATAKSPGAVATALHGLNFDRLLQLSPCFSGIPHTRLTAAVASLDVVHVPARRIIYDAGEPTHGTNYLVLTGHVRIFTIATAKSRQQQQQQQQQQPTTSSSSSSKAAGTEEKRLPKLLRKASQSIQATHAALEKQASARLQCPFDRYAGDHIFLRDYDRTAELTTGDCFGRQVSSGDDALDNSNKRARGTLSKRLSSLQQSQQHLAVCGESAITMSECLIGTISLCRPTNTWTLDAKEKRELIGLIQMREELESGADALVPDERSFSFLATSFKILELMRLGGRLTTAQRVCVATSLRYCRIRPGDVVYRQGDESRAMYFVMTGRVRLFARPKAQFASSSRASALSSQLLPEGWLVDLFESDVFGEEAMLDGCIGSNRLTTAVAATASVNSSEDVELLYLTRQQYDAISAPHMQVGGHHERLHRSGISEMDMYSRQLLGVGKQAISSRDRWRLAINRVIQSRAKRSLWHSVLLQAKRHRVELMFDLLGGLSVFRDTPKAQILTLCASATLQTFAPDSVVFARGDAAADQCFLVLKGTVMLQQFCSAYSSTTTGALALSSSILESSLQKVTVQTMRTGDVFGDLELLANKDERLIHAMTGSAATAKLIILPREDFRRCWPQHARLEAKLVTITSAFHGVHALESDHLCSLYYAMRERAFKRNEVMSGSPSDSGFMHIIESGFAVVHDRVTLQKRVEKDRVGLSHSLSRLAIDTRLASLGPGSILFTDKRDEPVATDPSGRRSVSKPGAGMVAPAVGYTDREYVTAESPVVHTFSLQLYPRSYHSSTSSSRSSELFAVVVLGKLGLQAIQTHISEHRSWRTDNTAFTSRVLESSIARESPTSPSKDSVRLKLQAAPNATPVRAHALGLTQFLKDRRLTSLETTATAVALTKTGPAHLSNQQSPRALTLMNGPQLSPSKAHAPLGSFGKPATLPDTPRETDKSKRFSFPSLSGSSKASDLPSALPQLVTSPPHKPSTGPASPSLNEQLRREELVLLTLSSAANSPVAKRKALEAEKQQRRRHGRPPPKIVENRGMFIDEHAFTAVATLQQEHDQKKSRLCRRLLYLK